MVGSQVLDEDESHTGPKGFEGSQGADAPIPTTGNSVPPLVIVSCSFLEAYGELSL